MAETPPSRYVLTNFVMLLKLHPVACATSEYELIQAAGGTYYVRCPAKIGIVRTGGARSSLHLSARQNQLDASP